MRVCLAVLLAYMTGLLHRCASINPASEDCLNYESNYHLARACKCVVYQSYGLNSGRFTSPYFPNVYPPNTNCILYTFIGDTNEIIELSFIAFDLKMPDSDGHCVDFLRIYQNLERPEVNEYSEPDLEFCGNYSSIRNKIYSSGRSLVLEFHSEVRRGHPGNYTGFKGIFKFLDKRNYTTTGTKVEGKQCTYDFYSNNTHRNGRFYSPFYPQNYKSSSVCSYQFHGQLNERVSIEFTNIQLHHLDASIGYYSCRDSPDVISVFDGPDERAPVIGQFCGMHNGEELISTGRDLLVTFTCDSADESQGFAATYKFISKSFSSKGPKSLINNSDSSIVPTTSSKFNCNENIDSRTHRNGTIESPFHPDAYPADITCRFIFTGVGRERIQLRFLHLDLHFTQGNPTSPLDCRNSDAVTVYIIINGNTERLSTWCGRKLPPMLMSSQHKMIVEFRSYHSSPSVTGFKAQYSFLTNFGIIGGEQDNRGTCVFNYMSSHKTSGEITSPNYKGLYPRNTECHYLFYGKDKERVHITFLEFDVDGISPRCEAATRSDYVSFSNFAETEDRKMTRLCGTPTQDRREVWSDGPFFRVIFKSNDIYDSTGFKAKYQFEGPNTPKRPNRKGPVHHGPRRTTGNDRDLQNNGYTDVRSPYDDNDNNGRTGDSDKSNKNNKNNNDNNNNHGKVKGETGGSSPALTAVASLFPVCVSFLSSIFLSCSISS